jgi:hypothetical protein
LNTVSPDEVGVPNNVPFGKRFDRVMNDRLREADEFYDAITPSSVKEDAKKVMRQALSGMLWTKQYYSFDLDHWLKGHGVNVAEATKALHVRNRQWLHMVNDDVISMPDKWEYPWYAAWDLAFHTVALSLVDPDFAKQQLDLMLREVYLHPNEAPRIRMEFRRREPSGSCLGGLLRVFAGKT